MEGFFFKGSRLFLVDVKSPGGGELSLSAGPGGWGIEHGRRKNRKSSGMCRGGGGG